MDLKEQGNNFEREFSREFHLETCPVLISSLLIRSIGGGQIDVAGLKRIKNSWLLILVELKSSLFPSSRQRTRLLRAQDYLGRVLEIETKLEVKVLPKS